MPKATLGAASKSTIHHRNVITVVGWAVGLACVAACARSDVATPKYPSSDNVMCRYVRLESIETPRHADQDSVALVAVYRFSESKLPPPKLPLILGFQVNRSRVDELRSHLESHPEVICSPDRGAHYQVQVAPLQPLPGGARLAPLAGGVPPSGEPWKLRMTPVPTIGRPVMK
jgi:hypothetical protein